MVSHMAKFFGINSSRLNNIYLPVNIYKCVFNKYNFFHAVKFCGKIDIYL